MSTVNDSINVAGPRPLDGKEGKFLSGVFRAFSTTTEANQSIISNNRYRGLTVLIGDPTNYKEYWWFASTDDNALVPKTGFDMPTQLSYYAPENYGALGNGTTNDSAAFTAAIAAMPSFGGVLYLGVKTYLLNTQIVINKSITVMGQGANDVDGFVPGRTRILSNSNIDVFYCTAAGITFQDFSMYNTASTHSAGSAIRIQSTGLGHKFQRLSINGFYDNIFFYDGGEWTMDTCQFMNNNRYNLYISREVTPDGGDQCISNCFFFTGGQAGIKYVSGGGLKITNSKFNSSRGVVDGNFVAIIGQYGIDVAINQGTSDFLISNCSLENYSISGIKLRTASPNFRHVVISGNQFAADASNTQASIDSDGISAMSIVGNVFTKGGSGTAIKVINGSDIIVWSNPIYGYTYPTAIVSSGLTKSTIQSSYTAGTSLPIVSSSQISGEGNEVIINNLSNVDYQGNFSVYGGHADSTASIKVFPRGAGNGQKSAIELFNSDWAAYQPDYECLRVGAINDIYVIDAVAGGTATMRPFSIRMDGDECFRIDIFSRVHMKSLGFQYLGTNNVLIGENSLFDGTNFITKADGFTELIHFENGNIKFLLSPASVLAGLPIAVVTPLSVLKTGRVGINTETPAFALDVNGVIGTNNSIGVIRNGSDTLGSGGSLAFGNVAGTNAMYFQLNAAYGVDVWQYNNVGGSSVLMRINADGTLTIPLLAGTGKRNITVDASGTLVTTAGRRGVADVNATIAATDSLIAYTSISATRSVTLPAASTVTGQHFIIKDESGSASGSIKITIVGTVDGAVNPDAIITAYGVKRLYSNGTAYFFE